MPGVGALEDILEYQSLSEAYDAQDMPEDFELTNMFFTNPSEEIADNFDLLFYPKMRRPAPINKPGAEARVITTGKAIERKGILISAFNAVDVPTIALRALREPDSYTVQKMGRTSVARILAEFAVRHAIMKEVAIGQIMSYGHCNFATDGSPLIPTVDANTGVITDNASAEITSDFGVANAHRGNLGGLITKLWTDPTALISNDIDNIRNAAQAAGTRVPTEIHLHTLSKQYLRVNDQFAQWAEHLNQAEETILQGEMIEGLWGMNWHFHGGKYETNANGDVADYWPQASITLCPPNGPWLKASNGMTEVPTQIGIQAGFMEALNAIEEFYGKYAYVDLAHNPSKLQMFMGDFFGLNFADPNAVWMPTVF
jgi:hypothetical protein